MFAAEIGFSRCEVVLRNSYVGKAQLCVQLRSQRDFKDFSVYINLTFIKTKLFKGKGFISKK